MYGTPKGTHLELEPGLEGLLGEGGRAGHVLIRRVGAGANETGAELVRPALLGEGLLELGAHGVGPVGGEGPVDVRLELREVDDDVLVVLAPGVGAKVGLEALGRGGEARAAGGLFFFEI